MIRGETKMWPVAEAKWWQVSAVSSPTFMFEASWPFDFFRVAVW